MLTPRFLTLNPRRARGRGQALAEFSLTAIVFFMLLMMIVELGRIFYVYVALQHAARIGARFAITGERVDPYDSQPAVDSHYVGGSSNPFERIAQCAPVNGGSTPVSASGIWEQPIRDERTCSIEDRTVVALAGVPMDPNANFQAGGPNSYYIDVAGVEADSAGDFVRGFGGDPGQYVSVAVIVNLETITPFFYAVAPIIKLQGRATMVNEGWGIPGGLTPGTLPFPGDFPPLAPETPPDLQVLSVNAPTPVEIGQPVTVVVTIVNTGDQAVAGSFDVAFGYSLTEVISPASLADIPGYSAVPGATCTPTTIPGLAGGGAQVTVNCEIPDGLQLPPDPTNDRWYFYAFVDSGNALPAPAAEQFDTNNIKPSGPVEVQRTMTIGVNADPMNSTAQIGAQTQDVTITVSNVGPDSMNIISPAGCTEIADGDPNQWTINITNLPVGGSLDITFRAEVAAGTDGVVNLDAVFTPPVGNPYILHPATPLDLSDTWFVSVGSKIDLYVGLTGPDPSLQLVAGDITPTVYTIVFGNAESDTVPGNTADLLTTISLTGGTYTATWTCAGAACPAASGTGEPDLTGIELGPTESITITLSITLSSDANGALSVTAQVVQTGEGADQLIGNEGPVTLSNTIRGEADLSITVNVPASPPVGTKPAITIQVTNSGPSDVVNATVSGNLTANNITFITPLTCSSTDPGASCSSITVGNTAFSFQATIPAGATINVQVRLNILNTASGDFEVCGQVTAPAGVTDPNLSNNNACDSGTVVIPPLFVNVGADSFHPASGGATCSSVIYSNAAVEGGTSFTYQLNKPYAAGDWGYQPGSQTWTWRASDFGGLTGAAEKALFGCAIEGSRRENTIVFRFDNRAPGHWRIYLGFFDPSSSNAGQSRQVGVTAVSGANSATILTGFNFFAAGANTTPVFKSCDFDITSAGTLVLTVLNETASKDAKLNAIGLVWKSATPVGAAGWDCN